MARANFNAVNVVMTQVRQKDGASLQQQNTWVFEYVAPVAGGWSQFFFHWYPPKKLKYGKSRLGESTLT